VGLFHDQTTKAGIATDLQTRLNDIRASNKISKTTVPDRYSQGKGRSRFATGWTNNTNSGTENKYRRGNHFLSKGRQWKQHPPKSSFQSKKDSQFINRKSYIELTYQFLIAKPSAMFVLECHLS
jgi:hypothetical protein